MKNPHLNIIKTVDVGKKSKKIVKMIGDTLGYDKLFINYLDLIKIITFHWFFNTPLNFDLKFKHSSLKNKTN